MTSPVPSERAQIVWGRVGAGPLEVLVPLSGDTGLVGLLVLGPKRSGEPYYSDDADLLATLGNHAAVAIRNALAHQRVVLLNEELMKILGTIESGVIAVGANRKVSLFNGAAQELTALPGASVLGCDAGQLPPPIGAYLEAALRDRASHSQEEFSLPDTAGQRRPLVCSTTPLLSPRGDVVGAVAVLGDLSRLKELEQERRRLERLGSLESIASGLVHEIRNPLLAVKTFAQLMPARHLDGDFRDTFGRVTGREIGRIEQLLTRFRSLATTSAQPMGPVDIREPIRNALEALQPQIEAQRVTLRQVADGSPRPIAGNTSQLEQLFLNLCLNALQAMESGGELTVRVADLAEGAGTTLLVEVSDTGPGIPENLLETIFNPFVTSKPGGTGLGLAICRGIADAHQARLSAENHVERPGCTFTLEFPVPAAERARSRS
jgi:two-component system sensor histidine kinase HydH